MQDVAQHFRSLLELEQDAARRADLDELVGVQQKKAAALQALASANLPDAELLEINALAAANVDLMRHLVGCLRGMLQPEPQQGYTARGGVSDEAPPRRLVKGAL